VDGGDFGSRVFSVTTKVLANREREFTTKSPLYTNNCYAFGFLAYFGRLQFSVSLPHRLSRKHFKNNHVMSKNIKFTNNQIVTNKNLKRKFLKKGIKSEPIIIPSYNIRAFLDEKKHPE
jgi:hypothetical protein